MYSGWVMTTNSSYVFLTVCSDFAEAQVIRSYLMSQGFHPRVKDEQTRAVAPHFGQALGKLTIEIPESEFLPASATLEKMQDEQRLQESAAPNVGDVKDEFLLQTQSLAKKALLNSILGCLVVPIFCTFYSILLSFRVLKYEKPMTSVSRRRLGMALAFNSLAFYLWLVMGPEIIKEWF
ncbi:hypothetical protein D3C87_144060 [compost metagenome]